MKKKNKIRGVKMRRFLSLVLMTALISAMTVSMPLSASAENLSDWQYFNDTNSRLYTSMDNGAFAGKYFSLASDDTGSVKYHSDGIEGISSEPVVDIASSKGYTCTYNEGVSLSKPVINFSFKVYIPEGMQNKARKVYFSLAKKDATTGNYNNANYGMVTFYITNSSGQFYGTHTENQNTSTDFSKKITCTTNTWHEINIRAFTNFEGKLIFGMYADGSLISVVSSTASDIKTEDIGIRQISFNNGGATTYIRDLRIDTEEYDAAYAPTLTNSVPDVSYLNNVQFNTINVDETTNALTALGYGDQTVDLKTSPQTSGHYKNGTTYENINYTLADDALKVDLTPSAESSGTHAIYQDLKKVVTSYFPSGTTKYMQMSYDIKIPAETETTERQQCWRLTNRSTQMYNYCYEINSSIVDGKLQFANKSTYKGANSTLKSTSFDIQNDKWYRIISLLEITNRDEENDYVIHNEGYVYDLENNTTSKIYDQVVNIPNLVAETDVLSLSQQQANIITPAVDEVETISTYYDNIITRISAVNFSDYYVNLVNQIPVSPIELTAADGVATAIGRSEEGAGAQKLLIAGYDKNGDLVSCGISGDSSDANTVIDAENGSVTFSWDFSTHQDIRSLKAFMFKDFSSIEPLSDAVASDIYRLTPVYTDGEGSSDIEVAERMNLNFAEFYERTGNAAGSSSPKRALCIKDQYLYILDKFDVFKIDISNPKDPVLVATTELSDVQKAYMIGTTQYPTNLTGVYIYNDKLIITTRMALNSMNSLLTDGTEECGSITMLNLSDLSVVDEKIYADRCQVSPGGIYKDVLIAGLVHGGVGAWKITDTGFEKIGHQDKEVDTAEYEYQGGAVDAENGVIYLSQYKYGVIAYDINYNVGDTELTFTYKTSLYFGDMDEFNRDFPNMTPTLRRTHAAMGLTVNDTHVFVPVAPIREYLVDEGDGAALNVNDNYSGVLVADKNDLTNYTIYRLPESAIPAMNVDNGTDQQPMFANFSDENPDELFVAIGDKGVCRYQWTEDEKLVYCDRWGEEEKQSNGDALLEAEFVQVFDDKVYAVYRYVDDSKNLLLKSWDIIR